MDILFIIQGLAIGIAVSVPLGPIGVLVIQRTINKGFISGLVTGTGASAADIVYAIIAGFSITLIKDFLINNQMPIRIIGGLFLVFVGVKITFANPAKQIRKFRNKGNRYFSDFLTSFLVTISNPITILAFGAIFASFQIITNDTGKFDIAVLIMLIFIGALIWWIILIAIISIFRKKIRLRNLLWINRITGFLIVLFAIFVIISAFLPETNDAIGNFH